METGGRATQFQTFVRELRRREVFQTAGLYGVGAFLVTEIALAFIDRSPLSASTQALTGCLLVSLFVGGFPIVLWLAWLFDLTRHGVVREKASVRGSTVTAVSAMGMVIALTGIALWALNPCGFGRVIGVAVLPCSCHGAQEYDYQAAGISVELNYRLSHLPQLHVPANSSIDYFSARLADPVELAGALSVDLLVDCTLRRDNSRIAFNLRLYRPDDAEIHWAKEFKGQASDELYIAAGALRGLASVDALNVEALAGTRIEEINGLPTSSHEAWTQFQRARYAEADEDLETALSLYRKAAALDPDFARAHASAARLLWLSTLSSNVEQVETMATLDAARAHIRRASQVARASSEALLMQRVLDDSATDPEVLHAKIVSLRPGYAEEYLLWSAWLAENGRAAGSRAALARARTLDPSGELERRYRPLVSAPDP